MKTTKRVAGQEAPCVRVNVKLAPGAERDRSLNILSRPRGVRSVIQTFPDETDEELARLYMLDVDPSKLQSALRELRHCPEVEYAEVVPSRKLIR